MRGSNYAPVNGICPTPPVGVWGMGWREIAQKLRPKGGDLNDKFCASALLQNAPCARAGWSLLLSLVVLAILFLPSYGYHCQMEKRKKVFLVCLQSWNREVHVLNGGSDDDVASLGQTVRERFSDLVFLTPASQLILQVCLQLWCKSCLAAMPQPRKFSWHCRSRVRSGVACL